MNLIHAYELVSTEGLYPFISYVESLRNREKKSKVIESILKNQELAGAVAYASRALDGRKV